MTCGFEQVLECDLKRGSWWRLDLDEWNDEIAQPSPRELVSRMCDGRAVRRCSYLPTTSIPTLL